MRIKITESQARLIGLLTENVGLISEIERYVKNNNLILNKIFNDITNMTLVNVLEDGEKLGKYKSILNKMYDTINSYKETARIQINKMDDDSGADMENRVDELTYGFSNKIYANEEIISKLEDLAFHYDNENMGEIFRDAGPIEIG